MWSGIDWETMSQPSHSLLEIFIRGTVVYLGLFLLLRTLRRGAGGVGITDILFIVLIADAIQNAMANEYRSLTEGFVLVATLAFWDYLFDWLGARYAFFERLLRPPALLLIRDGRLLHRNMRKEMITENELLAQLRLQGVDDPAKVKRCFIEGDGHMSVLKAE